MNRFAALKGFLIEFIMMFIMFVLCTVIIIGVFQAAMTKSTISRDKTEAYNIAQRLAEQFKTYNGTDNSSKWEKVDNENFRCFYDDEWNLCGNDKGIFEINVQIAPEETEYGNFCRGIVTVCRIETNEELCRIEVYNYTQKET